MPEIDGSRTVDRRLRVGEGATGTLPLESADSQGTRARICPLNCGFVGGVEEVLSTARGGGGLPT
jgi:hypothetical protein